ncbi:MAG: HAD hydrolase family protein, partial [Lentisphaerae bacterium]|nr:HAD hydrolase family protein [Lentisphaerota bacterium]
MTKIKLFATDLDGTVIGHGEDLHLYSVARDRINELRDRDGTVWVVCTGRSLRSFKSFFAPMRIMDAVPDYVIARHAYIYGNRSFGYAPHMLWNVAIRRLLAQDRRHVWLAVKEWYLLLVRTYARVVLLERKPNRLWVQFRSDKTAMAAEELLRPAVAAYRHMQIFRYSRELDIRSVPFTKGLALSELARRLG